MKIQKEQPAAAEVSGTQQQKYMVVVIDMATTDGTKAPLSSHHIVSAASPEAAERLAVAEDNAQNESAPGEDGGFIAIRAYSRHDLEMFLKDVSDGKTDAH